MHFIPFAMNGVSAGAYAEPVRRPPEPRADGGGHRNRSGKRWRNRPRPCGGPGVRGRERAVPAGRRRAARPAGRGVEARYGRASQGERRYLSWLLLRTGERGDPALIRLLGASEGDSARDLLYTAVQRELRLPAAELHRLARALGEAEPLVDAMGLSGDLGVAPSSAACSTARPWEGARLWRWEGSERASGRCPSRGGCPAPRDIVALELLDDPGRMTERASTTGRVRTTSRFGDPSPPQCAVLLLSRAEDNRGPEEGWSTAFNEVLAGTACPVPQA